MTNFEKAINQLKTKLIKKAKKYGIYENFGQNELRKFKDCWENGCCFDKKLYDDFYNWICNFTIDNL